MRRRRPPLLCLGAGALLTLLSAWIPPLIDPPMVSFPGLGLGPGEVAPWIGAPHTRWLGEPAWLATEGRIGIGVRRSPGCVEIADMAYLRSSERWSYVIAAGWPLYAFHGGGLQYPPVGPINDSRAPEALTLPTWVPTRQNHAPSVPVAPLWRGLLIDVAFWALLLLSVTRAAGAMRRSIRRRGGRCTSCGYPTKGAGPRCPECGSHPHA